MECKELSMEMGGRNITKLNFNFYNITKDLVGNFSPLFKPLLSGILSHFYRVKRLRTLYSPVNIIMIKKNLRKLIE